MSDTRAHHETGVCSWSLREHEPDALADILINTLNVRTLQLALDPLVEHHPSPEDSIAMLRDHGIRIASAMMAPAGEDYSSIASIRATGGFRLDDTLHANTERARTLAELAHTTGIPLITMHAGSFVNDDGNLDPKMLDRVRTFSEIFTGEDVDVAVETGHEPARDTLRLLDVLDTPRVGINFDPANIILYNSGDPIESLRLLLPRVVQCHIKDALPPAKAGEWGTEVTLLAESPRPMPTMVEREAGETRAEDISQALACVRTQSGSVT